MVRQWESQYLLVTRHIRFGRIAVLRVHPDQSGAVGGDALAAHRSRCGRREAPIAGMVMALINWRVPARLRGKFVLLKRAIGVVASAFQLGERGIVASARGLRVGRASGGVVVGQTIDDVSARRKHQSIT